MNKLALLISLAFLLSLVSAQQFSACLPYPSALGFNVENATYNGSYGNYTVYVQAFPPPSVIRVEGQDASQAALISEMELLQNNQMLTMPCNITKVQMFSYANYACAPDGTWTDADQSPVCSGANAGEGAMPVAVNAPVNAPSPPPAPKAMDTGVSGGAEVTKAGVATGQNAERAGLGAVQPPAAEQQPMVNAEQMLPLIAAFLAVVIISFLILQQRQESVQIEITAQDERLMQNETRAGIMQELEGADRIPTDLSSKLGKSKATIVEHLETLREAGFVERVATPGKKFVYYRLTQKGKRMLLKNAG